VTSSTRRRARLLVSGIALLLLSCCQRQSPIAQQESDLPAGSTLVRGGLAEAGGLVVALDDSGSRCRASEIWTRRGGGWAAAASGPALPNAACPRVTAQLAGDGRTLAIYDYSAGRAELQQIDDGAISPFGTAILGGASGIQFPPPGPNVALAQNGTRLLLGSLNHGCGVRADGERGCGMAQIFERRAEGWERGPAILPSTELAEQVQFGQSVALDAAGTLAVVGGMGQPGLSGALGVYALADREPRLVQILQPDKRLPGFAADLAFSGDGRWLAVGGDQAVHLYERDGEGFEFRTKLTPPDPDAGYFGETVALSGDGRRLLTGAPRTDCAQGARCGVAYLYERDQFWHLARALRPATNAEDANFGHHLTLSADGRQVAIQGAVIHVFALEGGS
jgi:hypothetical protein